MPFYEYVADYCVQSLFCSKRFVFCQRMDETPVTACPQCGAPLSRILSSFSAGIDMGAHAAAWAKIDAESDAPPATLKNMFGGGLGDLGCGHHHPDGLRGDEGCGRGCGAD
jgi:DNA-directed RNA polymerase subunit RPC12/RpoP